MKRKEHRGFLSGAAWGPAVCRDTRDGAVRIGHLLGSERVIEERWDEFVGQVEHLAGTTISAPALPGIYSIKSVRRQADESVKPPARYREEELEQMKRKLYGFDPSYHMARYNVVYTVPKSRMPMTIANHRREIPARKQVL